ncbi:MAG: DUF362 domain-containing protein [Thermodesulfobacteriota bacterium]
MEKTKLRKASGQEASGKSRVALRRVGNDPDRAVREVLESFPGAIEKLGRCRTVFIKVNSVYFHPHVFTSPALITAAVRHIRSLDPGKKIYLMDNCSQGNFTRLTFAASGLDRLAKELGAACLFLDEQKSVQVALASEEEKTCAFPAILNEHLLENRESSFYLNMPVLKAHCQARMTAGLKNQLGLQYDMDRSRRHNFGLHQKVVDIYRLVRPDFTLIDAVKVVARGPIPAGRYVKELLHDRDLVIGGTDGVAADAVAARVMGYDPFDVPHLKLAAEQSLGIANTDRIELDGTLPPVSEPVPWEFRPHFPEGIRFVKGKERACYEGCVGHAEQVLELLINDASSPEKLAGRPLTFVTGRSFEPGQLENLAEPVVVLGKCACKEALPAIRQRYRKVDVLDTCGRCDNILQVALKRLKINPVRLTPLSTLRLLYLYLLGRMNGLTYKLPLPF